MSLTLRQPFRLQLVWLWPLVAIMLASTSCRAAMRMGTSSDEIPIWRQRFGRYAAWITQAGTESGSHGALRPELVQLIRRARGGRANSARTQD
jgi:hypothetical protein